MKVKFYFQEFLFKKKQHSLLFKNIMVPKGGLEPPHRLAYAPQAYVSTNSTTWAKMKIVVHPVGFEPTTAGFEDRYSSN